VSVVSFEPSPNTLPYLTRTARGSPWNGRWTIIPKAAAERPGTLDFHAADSASALFDGLRDTGRGGATRTVSVPVTTLDTAWAELGRPVVSIIKIDVEGAESQVLAGAPELLAAHRPHILLEWYEENLKAYDVEPGRLLAFARANGYRVFAMPAGVPVDDVTTLRVQMVLGDTFLLSPAATMPAAGWAMDDAGGAEAPPAAAARARQ
jgi:FkbM family methyltransferase